MRDQDVLFSSSSWMIMADLPGEYETFTLARTRRARCGRCGSSRTNRWRTLEPSSGRTIKVEANSQLVDGRGGGRMNPTRLIDDRNVCGIELVVRDGKFRARETEVALAPHVLGVIAD